MAQTPRLIDGIVLTKFDTIDDKVKVDNTGEWMWLEGGMSFFTKGSWGVCVNRTWVDWPSSFPSSGGSCYFYDIHYKQTHRLCGHRPDLLWPTQSQRQGCGGCPHEGLTWLCLIPNCRLPQVPIPVSRMCFRVCEQLVFSVVQRQSEGTCSS